MKHVIWEEACSVFFFFISVSKYGHPKSQMCMVKLYVAFWWEKVGLFSGTTEEGKSLVSSALFLGIFHKKRWARPFKTTNLII